MCSPRAPGRQVFLVLLEIKSHSPDNSHEANDHEILSARCESFQFVQADAQCAFVLVSGRIVPQRFADAASSAWVFRV